MRLLIAGTGGVGGYYGARLLAAGHDVWFLARGPNLAALRERGLEVRSAHGDLRFGRVDATDAATEAGPVDVVLFCVKAYDNDSAAAAIEGSVRPGTAIVSLQNGVENEVFLAGRFPQAEVLAGIARVEAWLEAPGVIVQPSPQTDCTIGAPSGGPSGTASAIAEAMEGAGVPCLASEEMPVALWMKFLGICGVGGVTAYCRCTIGEVLSNPELNELIVGCWTEVWGVGRAHGIGLPDGAVAAMIHYAQNVLQPSLKSSMCRDVERGKPLEVEALNAAVVRFGQEAGIPTPANAEVTRVLLPLHRTALAARSG
jgi:2-dehydropantoate 2-reductase